MAVHNRLGYRSYRRVKNPHQASMGEVVLTASSSSDIFGFSPYSPITDNSGSEPITKVQDPALISYAGGSPLFDELTGTYKEPLTYTLSPLPPISGPTTYDSLVGLTLSDQQIIDVYTNVKQGVPIEDIAVQFGITVQQVGDIYTALLNGASTQDILNPASAQFDAYATLPVRGMSFLPIQAMDQPFDMLPSAQMFATQQNDLGLASGVVTEQQTGAENTAQPESSGMTPVLVSAGVLAIVASMFK